MASEEKPTTTKLPLDVTSHRIRDGFILFFTGLFLLLAQSAFWINQTIFNQQTFTSIVTPIITSESSRQAIASTITSRMFADFPLADQLLSKNVTQLITGLLGTDRAQQLQTTMIDRTYDYLTTDNPKPIAINLQPIKDPLVRITNVLESRGREVTIDPNRIPDSIVLFNPSGLPDIYGYSIAMLWLGPLFWIGFILLAILYVYLGRSNYPPRIYILGVTVIIASLIGLAIGPLLEPPVVAMVPLANLRGIIDQLMSALFAPFASQNMTAIAITVIVLIIFYSRFAIANGARWVTAKTSGIAASSKKSAAPKK